MDSVSDMDLVAESLSGDRDAFGQIVSKYQNLICSLAYSATGNLNQSEDLAQETFLTAWKQLGNLREPPKLRAWLCGIARNLIHNALRRQGREPAHNAETLEAVDESPATERLPVEHAISNEEQAILWRSLERIPEIYREPLVLFYREQQSVEAVARNLELSDDAVKQRLSRGRKLLQEEIAGFIEGALRQSAPDRAFTNAVLSALPTQVAAAAGASAGTAKSGGLLSMVTLPIIGFFGSLFGSVWILRNVRQTDQRRTMKLGLGITWLAIVSMIAAQNVAYRLQGHYHWSASKLAMVQFCNCWIFAFVVLSAQVIFLNHHRRMRMHPESPEAASPENSRPGRSLASGKGFMSSVAGVLAWSGMMLGGFAWLMDVGAQGGDKFTVYTAIIAMTVGIAWPTGMAIVVGVERAKKSWLAFVPTVLMFGVILLTVNTRLDRWIAAEYGMDFEIAHRIMPMWIVHTGTALLLVLVAALAVITKPKPEAGRA